MEMLAILLSGPVALVVNLVWCFLLAQLHPRVPRVMTWVLRAAYLGLGLFAAEVMLLTMLGAVGSRHTFGAAFWQLHVLLFFVATPSLGAALVLTRRSPLFRRWCFAAPICAMFAVGHVLLQYHVSEEYYGVDGTGGPFGAYGVDY